MVTPQWLRRRTPRPLPVELSRLRTELDAVWAELGAVRVRLEAAARAEHVLATMEWTRVAPPVPVLVSIILTTRNRSHLVRRAAASALAQEHSEIELLVVDDGSTDATPAVVGRLEAEDPRVRVITTDHIGLAAARNLALDEARGTLVTYVDDDNTMHPRWCKAVAWAFTTWPEAELGYGAQVLEREDGRPGFRADWPWLHFQPFDRVALTRGCITDAGAIVHRAGIPDARFDESLVCYSDWDLLVRMSARRQPMEIPAIAGTYTFTGDDRLSTTASDHDHEVVRARAVALIGGG